jgi:hypothetical protein
LYQALTNYSTIQEEMVAWMPHTHIAYLEDNTQVWEIIRDSLHETEAPKGRSLSL